MKRFGNLNSAVRLLAVALFAIPLAVFAEAVQKHELRIAIDDGTPDGQLFFDLHDGSSGINLADLQVGESQSIVDESGRSVLVTRTEEGYELNVDGKNIELPDFDVEFGHDVDVEFDSDPDVDVNHGIYVMKSDFQGAADAITIVSGETIDDATKDAIRSLLSSAGHTSEVVFVNPPQIHNWTSASHDGEMRRHVVIRKEVEVAN